jgi:hypothetical protein
MDAVMEGGTTDEEEEACKDVDANHTTSPATVDDLFEDQPFVGPGSPVGSEEDYGLRDVDSNCDFSIAWQLYSHEQPQAKSRSRVSRRRKRSAASRPEAVIKGGRVSLPAIAITA